jgi:hypothetical protein
MNLFEPYLESQPMKTFPVISRLFLLVAGALLLSSTLAAQEKEYVSEKYLFSMVPPKGFAAIPDADVKAMFQASREQLEKPEGEGELPPAASISKVVFMPQGTDPSSRSIIVHAGYPPARSVEEFEKLITPDTGDFVVHNREILTLNYRQCFVIDREFDTQGIRMRQIAAYVPAIMPGGYLINFSAVSVDFDEYKTTFMDCLKTFKPMPPKDTAPEVKQSKYGGKGKGEKKPAWRSTEVILSLIFVAAVVIWFLVKRLSAGAEEEAAELPGDEGSKEE